MVIAENPPSVGSQHLPVMLSEVLEALAPSAGKIYVDGTFGAGGYSRAVLQSAHCSLLAIDQDPNAAGAAATLETEFLDRFKFAAGRFADMEDHASDAGIGPVDGVVLDIGVSSMQIDDGSRGFSFMRDGPLDMRMSQSGRSAADIVATASAEELADIIYHFGEEPRSRAIARAIVAVRAEAPIATTLQLVKAIEKATGPQRHNVRIHPATKTFQALRIYVNSELDQLAEGLFAAERLLAEGGRLVVVTFHSLEDRIVKRFFAERSGNVPSLSRHTPGVQETIAPSFTLLFKGHRDATDAETLANPRARSAKLRMGIRTAAKSHPNDLLALGVPMIGKRRH